MGGAADLLDSKEIQDIKTGGILNEFLSWGQRPTALPTD